MKVCKYCGVRPAYRPGCREPKFCPICNKNIGQTHPLLTKEWMPQKREIEKELADVHVQYEGQMRYFLDNKARLKRLADLQDAIYSANPEEAFQNDCEHFILMDTGDMTIHNPFQSECFRFPVNPIVHYGECFIKSDWFNPERVNECTRKLSRLKVWRRTTFHIEGAYEAEGYTKGERWNGWECPYFPVDQAMKIIDKYNSSDYEGKAWYDDKSDTCNFEMGNGEVDVYQGDMIRINDDTIHVYAIGAAAWIWEEV